MTSLPPDLVARPAVESARLVALAYLERSRAARARLTDPKDAEALHDFRVALRRLRSTLRAYQDQLRGSVSRKLRDRIRDLARATNRGRDGEVQLAWLRPLASELAPVERVGLRWLMERIERTQGEDGFAEMPRAFDKLDRQLQKKLAVYRQSVAADGAAPAPAFGLVARDVLRAHAQRLDELLGKIHVPDDHATIHRARIAAKRLRYVLEPIETTLPAGAGLVSELKSLQNVLGDLCDTRVLERTLLQAVEESGAEWARGRFETALADGASGPRLRAGRRKETRGLLAIARRLQQRALVDYGKLETTWLGGGEVFAGKIEVVAAPLTEPSRVPVPPPMRPRRAPRRRAAGRPV
jgi:CHAD domain-containing protein